MKELDKLLQKLYEDNTFDVIVEERQSMETEAAVLKRKPAEDGETEKNRRICKTRFKLRNSRRIIGGACSHAEQENSGSRAKKRWRCGYAHEHLLRIYRKRSRRGL